MNYDNLKEMAMSLGKYDHTVVEDGCNKHLLCGTPMAFDDEVEMQIRETAAKIAKLFGFYEERNEMDCNMDLLAEIRDKLVEFTFNTYDTDITYGTTEY